MIRFFFLTLFVIFTLSSIAQNSEVNSTNKDFDQLIISGRSHLQNNQIDLAIEAFEKAILLNSKKPDGHYGLGVAKAILCYQSKSHCNEAILYLKKALSITPNYRKALFNIGTCYISLGEYHKSIKYLDEAINNDTTNGEYYLNRGFAKLKLNDKNGACEDFHLALHYGYQKAIDHINSNCK